MSGHELEEALVDASELLGAEVLVVDVPAGSAFLGLDDGEMPDGGEQCVVAQGTSLYDITCCVPEESADPGQPQLGPAGVRAEPIQGDRQCLPQVGVARAPAAGRDPA